MDNTNNPPEIIDPNIARQNIEEAIIERLGADWQSQWLKVHESNFLVRLNKGAINLDFQAGLLGDVEIIEGQANPLQTSGRFLALMVLGASLFLALAIAFAAHVI